MPYSSLLYQSIDPIHVRCDLLSGRAVSWSHSRSDCLRGSLRRQVQLLVLGETRLPSSSCVALHQRYEVACISFVGPNSQLVSRSDVAPTGVGIEKAVTAPGRHCGVLCGNWNSVLKTSRNSSGTGESPVFPNPVQFANVLSIRTIWLCPHEKSNSTITQADQPAGGV